MTDNRTPSREALIYEILRAFRCHNIHDADGEAGFPLVDLVSNDPPADISTGQEQLRILAYDIDEALTARQTTPGAGEVHIGANGQPVERINIAGREQEVDVEIAPIVRALNTAGIETVASCSGHGERVGNIALRDGRELLVAPSYEEARRVEAALAKPQVPDVGVALDRARELWARCMENGDGRAKLSIAADIRAGTLDDSPAMAAILAALSAQSPAPADSGEEA